MSDIIHVQSQNEYNELTQKQGLVLCDFWAAWCAPCRMFGEIFQQASENYKESSFAKIDIEKNQELAQELKIMSIPHLAIYKNGELVYSKPGALNQAALEELIKTHA